MKSYLEEMEYALNPMKKIYDEMNPIKNVMDSMKLGSVYDNFYSGSYVSAIDKIQKEMEYTLNPMKKIYDEMDSMKNVMDSLETFGVYNNLYSTSTFLSSFEEFQKKIAYDLNPLKKLQDEMEYISNPLKTIQDKMNINFDSINQLNFLEKSINPMRNAIEVLNLANTSGISKIDQLNEILKSLNINSITVEETIQSELEEQIDSLTKEDKKILDEVIDSLKQMFPDISYLSESLSKGKYIAIIMYILFVAIPTIYSIYEQYFKQNAINSYYKINRNNVNVRTEPSTDSNSIVIMKLNKNIFVEKIDSYENWLKIEFENDNGEEKQGWVRQDMLTKIENE